MWLGGLGSCPRSSTKPKGHSSTLSTAALLAMGFQSDRRAVHAELHHAPSSPHPLLPSLTLPGAASEGFNFLELYPPPYPPHPQSSSPIFHPQPNPTNPHLQFPIPPPPTHTHTPNPHPQFPPSDSPFLSRLDSERETPQSAIDPLNVDPSRHPLFIQATPRACVVHPGGWGAGWGPHCWVRVRVWVWVWVSS